MSDIEKYLNYQLIEMLGNPNPNLKRKASNELVRRGTPEVIELVENLYDSIDQSTQAVLAMEIVFIASSINSQLVVPLLLKLLKYSGENEGSIRLKSASSLKELQKANKLDRTSQRELIKHIKEEEWLDVIDVLLEIYTLIGSDAIPLLVDIYEKGQHIENSKTDLMKKTIRDLLLGLGYKLPTPKKKNRG